MSSPGKAADQPDVPGTIELTTESARPAAGEAVPSLWRNRNYNILWISLLFSMLGSEMLFVAFPLLIIARSGSPVLIGMISATLALTRMAANIPAGIIADRWNRRNLMLLSQGMRAISAAGLTVALLSRADFLPYMFIAAVVEGIFSSTFEPTEHAVLPEVVDSSQLSAAIARNSARPFVALLLGPAAAGLTFAFRQYAPFLIDAGMLGASFVALLLLRIPRMSAVDGHGDAQAGTASSAPSVKSGFQWILRHPVIRWSIVWMIFINLAFNALIIIIIAVSGENRVASSDIGLMMTCLGVGGIAGAVAAEQLAKHFSAPLLIIGATWILAVMAAVMIVSPKGILLGVIMGGGMLFAPVANTTIMTYHLTVAPTDLRGRLSGIVGFCSEGAGVLGPLAGGFLVAASGRGSGSVAACAAALAAIALVTTMSKTMRHFPAVQAAPAATEV